MPNTETITVKNAEEQPDTTAEIIVSHRLEYTPKVSVIIPVHNVERYLGECVKSIIGQTLKEIEIICVDDGSTDDSLKILQEYAAKDARIMVLHQANTNAGVARNVGLAVARGEYLSFLDSDDFFEPDMLASLYKRAKEQQAQICVYGSNCFDMEKGMTYPMPWGLKKEQLPAAECFSGEDIRKYIYNFSISWVWNKFFETKYIRENQIRFQSIRRTNDLYFVYLALSLADRITTLDRPLIHYRKGHGNNLQATNAHSPKDWYYALMLLKKKLVELGIFSRYEQSFVNVAIGGCQYNLNSIRDKKVKETLKKEIVRKLAYDVCIMKHLHDKNYFYKKNTYNSFISLVESCQRNKLLSFVYHSRRTENYVKFYIFGIQMLKKKLKNVS